MGNLIELLETPIRCTLPLAELLKAKPELWKEVGKCLKHIGIDLSFMERMASYSTTTCKSKIEPIPKNKVGQYNDGEDANTTLPVELNDCKHIAILDSGVCITIATKSTWEQWGKPTLRQSQMRLQLADGHIQRPIGLLKRALVTTYGIEYEHTFVVVDFGQNPNYDVILGRLFMRQLKMIQD